MISNSCIDHVLREFHYTVKKVDTIPVARNIQSTIEQRYSFAQQFRKYEQENPIDSFIYIDEVGFQVSTG